MMTKLVLALASAAVAAANAEVYFQENFNDAAWDSRWVTSSWKPAAEVGKFAQVSGQYFADASDKAIKTSEDARFYALSAKFDKPLNNKDKDLYLSYLVQHEQKLDCGGAYIKLLPADLDQAKFGGDSPYSVMFGPDICGSTRKTHAILNYARPGKDAVNMDHKSEIRTESDSDAHLYTFVLKKDNTYDVQIDGTSVKAGNLAENWPFQPEKQIKDPNQSKPADWVDDKMMPDPEDKKPEGWDDIPRTIPDPEAEKPEDWDDEDDGEWEPAMIENPEYKGEWQPKLINNPDYKGEWVHPMIDNPEYFESDDLYNVAKNVGAVGFELWQVKSGTLFDDIIVTDDVDAFKQHEEAALEKINAAKDKKKEIEDAEKTKAEEEAKKKEEEEAKKDDEAKEVEKKEEAADEKDEL
ncbi:Calreticulin precursor, partial [Globisporangium splendens]